MNDSEREARALYYLRRGIAELGMSHAISDHRTTINKLERVLGDLGELVYNLESGEFAEPPEFPIYYDAQGNEHGEF